MLPYLDRSRPLNSDLFKPMSHDKAPSVGRRANWSLRGVSGQNVQTKGGLCVARGVFRALQAPAFECSKSVPRVSPECPGHSRGFPIKITCDFRHFLPPCPPLPDTEKCKNGLPGQSFCALLVGP